MPKGKTPSLIGFSNGRPKRVEVQRQSKCCRCRSAIAAGADCFDIPKKVSGFTTERRHCGSCYELILKQTRIELQELGDL